MYAFVDPRRCLELGQLYPEQGVLKPLMPRTSKDVASPRCFIACSTRHCKGLVCWKQKSGHSAFGPCTDRPSAVLKRLLVYRLYRVTSPLLKILRKLFLDSETFWVQMNYQLIHLMDFLPIADWSLRRGGQCVHQTTRRYSAVVFEENP